MEFTVQKLIALFFFFFTGVLNTCHLSYIMSRSRDKAKGGRKLDPIRHLFEELTKDDNIVEMRCKNCSRIVSSKACRLRNHYANCSKTLKIIQNSDETENISDSSIRSHSPIPLSSSSEKRTKLQPSISSFVIKTTKSDKENLDKAIAKYFFSCNVPFNHANRHHFKKMIEELRPGYSPPTRHEIGTTLLDSIADEVVENAKKELKSKNVTLIQDGWSTIHNDPVIANCISDGKNVYFLSAIDTEVNQKTTDYCIKLAEEAITKCESMYGCSVKSFVSDNEAKMVKLRKELQQKYSSGSNFFISYGCAAHYLNLLGSDISKIKNNSLITGYVIEVSKYFRNHHIAKGLLNSYCGLMPQLPNETRWNSTINCLETYVRNKDIFLKIIDENEERLDSSITNIINNIGLYKEIKQLIIQLKPISISLDALQRDSANIADATKEFLSLLKSEELKMYTKLILKRFNDCITPAHILSFMLHPKYMGKGLNADQEETARQWVNEIDENFLPLIVLFSIKASPFPKTYFGESVVENLSPSEWWESLRRYEDLKNISNFASHLFRCVASSASIERVFSNFSMVQSKIRNRLGLDKAAKLVMTYKMLNSKDQGFNLDSYEEY